MASIAEVVVGAGVLLDSEEVGYFLDHFGVMINPHMPNETIEKLRELDPRKGGLKRFELEADSTVCPEVTHNIIMAAAKRMGMLKIETPLEGNWDLVVALGGARRANFDRLNYAAEAIVEGRATTEALVIVGSTRELNDAERKQTSEFAPGAMTEYDLCISAFNEVGGKWTRAVDNRILVEDQRATTYHVMQQAIQEFPRITDVAAVTTQIYQLFTLFDLARVASWHQVTRVMVAGNPSDPAIIKARTPATYLSEVIRTLIAAVTLLADVGD